MEAAKCTAFFDTLAADWIGISEYSENFTTDGSMKATTSIFSRYPVQKVGQSQNYQWNAQFGSSRFEVLETITHYYTNHTQNVYYYAQRVKIDGETEAWFVQTHMDWSDAAIRRSQFEELLAGFKDKEFVVIAGDYNCAVNGVTEWDNYARFTAEGFTLALTDESRQTYPQKAPDRVIDNIIVKGFTISNVRTYPDCVLSDHVAVSCRLALPTDPVEEDPPQP